MSTPDSDSDDPHALMRKGLEAPTTTESLRAMVQFHSGVFDDVVSTQLEGWGASNFLVHGNRSSFKIVAEFRSGSGSMFDRQYAANALRTWHELAEEVLRLRQIEDDAARLARVLRDGIAMMSELCDCDDERRCPVHEALDTYRAHRRGE